MNQRDQWIAVGVFVAASLCTAHGQSMQRPVLPAPSNLPASGVDAHDGLDDPAAAQRQQRMLKQNLDDDHKRMLAEADRLVALANQVHDAVASAKNDELSIDVIRKAEQMEKLARDIRNRMRN